jgi:hypothetical protein
MPKQLKFDEEARSLGLISRAPERRTPPMVPETP